MRTLKFRDVLWQLAEKCGLDPQDNLFLANEATAMTSYINAWVRREFDAVDNPELTKLEERTPDDNHIVAWEQVIGGTPPIPNPPLTQIGRVFKVYLLDPRTTRFPVETPFRLTEDGVYVGLEHGFTVWIKFLPFCPQFTSKPWDNVTTFNKDDVTYVDRTGNCYKSKVNNNVNNDPTLAEQIQDLMTQRVQLPVPGNPGVAGRPEIMVLYYAQPDLPPPPADPPPAGTVFNVGIFDENLNLIGSDFHTATGSESLATIITNQAIALDASLPGSFTVTADTTAKTITIQDNSYFTKAYGFYKDTNGVDHNFGVKVTQSYIPPMAGTPGQPQLVKLSLSPAQVIPGATYALVLTEPNGTLHGAQYVALATDSGSQILAGLVAAIEAQFGTDPWLATVTLEFDPTAPALTIGTPTYAGFAGELRLPLPPIPNPPVPPPGGDPYWEVLPFPFVLVDQVVRGAYSDWLKENGQTDKGLAEEQLVPAETAVRVKAGTNEQFDPLTDQQRGKSRYGVR